LRHYACYACNKDGKLALAKALLHKAQSLALKELPEFSDLQRHLRMDIAEIDHLLGNSEEAVTELLSLNRGFAAGDILLQNGRFEEAFAIYQDFHEHGPFKIH
jgi:hypothetical protein